MYVISRAAGSKEGADVTTLEKLSKMLEGADTKEENSNSEPRDIQFELSLAAHLAMGGIKLWLAEPDIVVCDGLLTAGVAAKNLGSPAGFQKLLRA